MILADQISAVGHIAKTHGIHGEVVVILDNAVDLDAVRCLVLDVDGIFVPFFIASSRPRGAESVLVTFDDIDDEKQAASLVGKIVYALDEDLPDTDDDDDDDGFYLSDLVGFTASVGDQPIGTVTGYDDTTDNILLEITTPEGKPLLIPAVDDFFQDIDTDNRHIELDLPDDLITMQQ